MNTDLTFITNEKNQNLKERFEVLYTLINIRNGSNYNGLDKPDHFITEMDEIIETAAAFANTEGGRIFIGVSPDGKVLGVQVGKGTIEKLVNQIAQQTDPKIHPNLSVKKIDSKEVIVVEVKESHDHLALAFGKPYRRVGRSTVKMTKDEYERLILEKHKDKLYFDEQICKGAKITDVSKEKLLSFVERAREQRGLSIDSGSSVTDVLRKLKLMRDGKLTNAAILLFGKDTQVFFLQAELKASGSFVTVFHNPQKEYGFQKGSEKMRRKFFNPLKPIFLSKRMKSLAKLICHRERLKTLF